MFTSQQTAVFNTNFTFSPTLNISLGRGQETDISKIGFNPMDLVKAYNEGYQPEIYSLFYYRIFRLARAMNRPLAISEGDDPNYSLWFIADGYRLNVSIYFDSQGNFVRLEYYLNSLPSEPIILQYNYTRSNPDFLSNSYTAQEVNDDWSLYQIYSFAETIVNTAIKYRSYGFDFPSVLIEKSQNRLSVQKYSIVEVNATAKTATIQSGQTVVKISIVDINQVTDPTTVVLSFTTTSLATS